MATNYSIDCMVNINEDGMNDDLWQLAKDDAETFNDLDISSDENRNLYFYIDNFCEDVCEELGYINDKNRDAIVKATYNYLKHKENVDLNDIRTAFLKSLNDVVINKKAYPNIQGVMESNSQPSRDINKWVDALKKIHDGIYQGFPRDEVSDKIMEDWDPMEKLNFGHWAKFYESGDHDKYGLKPIRSKVAFNLPDWMKPQESDLDDMSNENTQPTAPMNVPTPQSRRGPGRPRGTYKKEKTLKDHKKDIVNKLYRAERTLENFHEVWDRNVLESLHHELNDLRTKILLLQTEATMNDCIVRTANRLDRKYGLSDYSHILKKIAEDPEDLSSRIEKALTGREYDIKSNPNPAESGNAGEETIPPLPDMPEEEDLDGEGELPEEMKNEMEPPMEEEPKDLEVSEEQDSFKENPYKNAKTEDVISILEPIQKKLKERSLVRELAKADMMMEALNIASHFPELGEAQAKQIEATSYIEKRLDEALGKLKGGLEEESENTEDFEAPEEIDMEGLGAEQSDKAPGEPVENLEVEEGVRALPELEDAPGVIGEPPKAITTSYVPVIEVKG